MSEKNNSSNQKEGGFWTTLPGILTALGTLIAAITGLIAILHQIGFFKPDETIPPGTTLLQTTPPGTTPPQTTSGNKFGFVIGGASPSAASLAGSVKDQIGQFPNMKICESKKEEVDRFYLVIGSVGSESEADKLKKEIEKNGKFLPGSYTMYGNNILFDENKCSQRIK
jgi:hypothetical protein